MTQPQRDHYYRCNGRQFARGLYGIAGKKCPAKNLNGRHLEAILWGDIESFLRNPGEILERLRERICMQDGERVERQKRLDELIDRLQQKTAERDRVLGLFRRGRIDEGTLDQQLDLVNAEAAGLQAEIENATRALSVGHQVLQLATAESILTTLRNRLDGPVPPELKRRIVEVLVESIQANTLERWGVKETQIVISYKFSQPNEPAALVLPRTHRISSRHRAPEVLNTIGDHLLRRRLVQKMLQREVAQKLNADKASIANWELNRTTPGYVYMPAIIRFLGYNPLPPSSKWSERLVNCRIALGLSQKESASRLGVDACTLARWERGEREPAGRFVARALLFVTAGEAIWLDAVRIA